MGDRWWRVAVEQLLWKWTEGKPFDNEALEAALLQHVSPNLESVKIAHPIVSLNTSLRPDVLVDIADAVEIQPDDWPAYADQAWVSRSALAESPVLQDLVVVEDREKLLAPTSA